MTMTVHYARRRLTHVRAPAQIATLGQEEFTGYASLFGVADGAGDVVEKGAFAASLRKRPAEKVRLLYQHFAHEPIGVWEEIREDGQGLFVRGRLLGDVCRAREVMALMREGAIGGLSIGFRTIRAVRDAQSHLRHLKEIELWEISVVTFPLLEAGGVSAVGRKSAPSLSASKLAGQIRYASRMLAAQVLSDTRIQTGEKYGAGK